MARKRTQLLESVSFGGSEDRVDRAAGVIRGVKVIGLRSRNRTEGMTGTRSYTRECLEAAVPLYEGAQVFFGHTRKAGQKRPDDEPAAGWLQDVRYERDGVYADLHVMQSHPNAGHLLEAAERNPSLWCLSQNAHGTTRQTATGVRVDEILEVHSVDLVRKGGTTTSLFEGVAMKLSEYVAELSMPDGHRKAVQALMEDGYMDGEMPVDAPLPAEGADQADHEAALKSGFQASCNAIVQAGLDGQMDPAAALKKLGELIKAHAKLSAPDKEEGLEEDDESCDTEKKDEKPMKESAEDDLKARIAELEAEKNVRELCEELNVRLPERLVKAAACWPQAERKELLESWTSLGHAERQPATTKPRNQKPGAPAPDARTTKAITDAKSFVAVLKGD